MHPEKFSVVEFDSKVCVILDFNVFETIWLEKKRRFYFFSLHSARFK